jgi:hypothetical protein
VVINILLEEMIPGEIHILPTDNTPEVLLNPDGIIKIKGPALTVNTTEVPEQILKWIDAYLSNPPEITYVIIAFEYIKSFNVVNGWLFYSGHRWSNSLSFLQLK